MWRCWILLNSNRVVSFECFWHFDICLATLHMRHHASAHTHSYMRTSNTTHKHKPTQASTMTVARDANTERARDTQMSICFVCAHMTLSSTVFTMLPHTPIARRKFLWRQSLQQGSRSAFNAMRIFSHSTRSGTNNGRPHTLISNQMAAWCASHTHLHEHTRTQDTGWCARVVTDGCCSAIRMLLTQISMCVSAPPTARDECLYLSICAGVLAYVHRGEGCRRYGWPHTVRPHMFSASSYVNVSPALCSVYLSLSLTPRMQFRARSIRLGHSASHRFHMQNESAGMCCVLLDQIKHFPQAAVFLPWPRVYRRTPQQSRASKQANGQDRNNTQQTHRPIIIIRRIEDTKNNNEQQKIAQKL